MAHNIEIRNGVASFAENGKKERAWHGLGDNQQIFDRPMFVDEALKACHADYSVSLQPIVALSPQILKMMENGEMINPDMLLDLVVNNSKATMRTDHNEVLGLVSDTYGLVQNSDAFKFVDMLCSGKIADRTDTPLIETCGVLGKGERVFVTAKFPKQVVLDAQRDDLMDMYAIFTTSHDGTGAVKCVISGVRTVCNNTLQLALQNNIGRFSLRHTSNVMNRIDLFNKENAEFAYKVLNIYEVYSKSLKESYDHLRNIRLSEKELDKIIAEITLSEESNEIFKQNGNIFDKDIPTRGRNIYLNMKECIESGVGQDILERGTAQWALNGITSFYQNVQNFKDNETKFDSIMDGKVCKNVNKAYDLLLKVA